MKYRQLKKKVKDIIKKYPKRYSMYGKKDKIRLMKADLTIKKKCKDTKGIIDVLIVNPLVGLFFMNTAADDNFLRDEMMKVMEAESQYIKNYLKQ